ncbi:alginate lyase family protein [Streptomyces sp. AC550_RSS872]|uniref:alginate lyase family protein n=1 Tax=Streptomyces sp. AC550_RSS872 TaxID=2823689 RepID=UPI0027E3D17D|nr:alginate lyase family protein [Streptomyces sp. AC550_RSS872]
MRAERAEISRRSILKIAGTAAGAATVGAALPAAPASAAGAAFAHPGMLHTRADLDRMAAKVKAGAAPYTAGFAKLTANRHSQSTWRPNSQATPTRGGGGAQNYGALYRDIHAAYQNALRWKITGDTAHADTARDICNTWSGTLKGIGGGSEVVLLAGIYGYQFANVGELMRGYPGFDLARFQDMLVKHFYPMNRHMMYRETNCIGHYWANWDLCTMASIMAIGILCDDRAKFNETVDYFHNGEGNGSLAKAIPYVYEDVGLAQWQESGRDQAHSMMGIGLMGTICEMAWNQGVDLYGADDSRFRKACEYVARYNLGYDVPYTTYTWRNGAHCVESPQTVISEHGRGGGRPVWERVYNHYANRRGMAMPNTGEMVARVRREGGEGGGGDYGPNSGGFDELGFGTLAFTRDRSAKPKAPASSPPSPSASAAGAAHATPSPSASPQGGRDSGDLAATGSSDLTAWTAATGITAVAGGLLLLRRRGRTGRDA